jgi:DNA-binding response OmpR family regulator/curved DNA-binding protein CbpA
VAPTKTVNVLIVDDDRSTQRVLADALTKQGFVVTVERDGEWAVKTFEKKSFDAVLLDLLLPAVNGYEVARQMKAMPRGKRTPIIMMSGVYKNAVHQREAVEKHGAFAFLAKPLDLKTVVSTLKDALGDRFPRKKKATPPPPPVEEDEVTGEFMADLAQREEVEVVEQAARQVASPGLSLRGDFATRSFAEVLAEVHRWRASGALLLRREKVKKIVYFTNGTPELVKSNLLVECLGRILVREKMISEAECAESLKRMKGTGRQQGTVLIDMGCISPHNLNYALHVQLQEKLFDIFRWESGEYQFNPRVELPAEPVSLGLTCAQLILEGVKRGYDDRRLGGVLEGTGDKYVHPSEEPLLALQDAGLGDEEKELLVLADGHKTVTTLRALGLLPAVDTDRLLFAMKCAQMIDFRDQAAKGKPRAPIAKLVETAKPPPIPPPLPSMPPPLPPPLPPRASAKPLLDLPWENAPLAQPMAAPPAPPPPPASPPARKKSKKPDAEAGIAKPMGSLLPELSAVVHLPSLSTEDSQVRERLANQVAAMRKLDYFEVLGVKQAATREDIKRAYFALAKEYHPDKQVQSKSAEVRALAQELYDLVSTAHDTLTDPAEKARYLKELAQGSPKRDMGDDVGKILAAEGKFQRGEERMRDRDYAGAYKLFSEAIAAYPGEGEFHAWLGWSLFQVDATRAEESLRAIDEAIALNPRLDKAYLFLGYIQKATGRPDKAEKQFEKAIQCNPDCTEALRELRLLGRGRR